MALLLGFEVYLRPGELTKLQEADMVSLVKKSQVYKLVTVTFVPDGVGDSTSGHLDNVLHRGLPGHQLLGLT